MLAPATPFAALRLRHATPADELVLPPLVGSTLCTSGGGAHSPRNGEILNRADLLGLAARLIGDGTLWVACEGSRLLAHAAWTFRARPALPAHVDSGEIRRPGHAPALIYGVLPAPDAARDAPSNLLLARIEQEVRGAGYDAAELVTTPDTAPRYLARGYRVLRELDVWLPDGGLIRAQRLYRRFDATRLSIV